jgi:hypothetical protein
MDKFHLERPFCRKFRAVVKVEPVWRGGSPISNASINLNRIACRVTRHEQKKQSLIDWKILVDINHSDLAEILTPLCPL